MVITELRLLALYTLLLALAGCATGSGRTPTMADMDIVAKDRDFALVRLKTGQDFADLAHVFLGHASERWQVLEVNGDRSESAGQVVAVPLRPVNPSSVYPDGYRTLPILCYHQFTQAAQASHQLELSATAFEAQLRYLVQNGYRFLGFEDVRRILLESQPIPDKAVVITIDDGYRSVYEVAWPLLRKYDAQATLFLYTDFIGAPAALSWQQVEEMAGSGLIEIESHAKSHNSLSRQPTDRNLDAYKSRVREEMRGSNQAFSNHHGAVPRYLSYPYGNSSNIAAEIAREEGMLLAATVTRGDNTVYADPYLLHRTMIYDRHDMADFTAMVQGFRKKNLK